VDALGTALFDLGIQNTKVAVIGENSYEWILTYLAVVCSGGVIVPLDKELPPGDIMNILNDCGAAVLVFSDMYSDIAEFLQNERMMIRNYINMNTLPGLLQSGRTLIQQGEKRIVNNKINNQALTVILYTSGTTGTSKGVMLSHKNIASNVVKSAQSYFCFGVSLLVLPLHHSFSFTAGVLYALYQGCNIVINKSMKDVAGDMVKYKPNNMFLVPLFVETLYKKVWDTAKKSGKDGLLRILIKISNALLKIGIDLRPILFKQVLAAFGGALDGVITGGAPISIEYIKGFRALGLNAYNGYGISECSPVVSINRNKYFRDGSVGSVLPGIEIKIMEPDDTGNGEICVKGDIVMLGYYNNEQATNEAFDGEWFKTGDIGRLDKDGFLYISGRKKNLIVLSNGKNVYPEDLESTLLDIPYIKEVVVYAEGDIIVAEVFLDTENEPDNALRLDSDIVAINRTLPP
jgi:long-chain acyl-CoA synthetase